MAWMQFHFCQKLNFSRFKPLVKVTQAPKPCQKLHEMAKQLYTSLTSSSIMLGVTWSGVKHTITGLWSCGKLFLGVKNHKLLV